MNLASVVQAVLTCRRRQEPKVLGYYLGTGLRLVLQEIPFAVCIVLCNERRTSFYHSAAVKFQAERTLWPFSSSFPQPPRPAFQSSQRPSEGQRAERQAHCGHLSVSSALFAEAEMARRFRPSTGPAESPSRIRADAFRGARRKSNPASEPS